MYKKEEESFHQEQINIRADPHFSNWVDSDQENCELLRKLDLMAIGCVLRTKRSFIPFETMQGSLDSLKLLKSLSHPGHMFV